MERVRIDDLDAETHGGSEARSLSDALGTTDLALNHYRIPPGEGTPSGLHAHADQEEVFLVVDGTATFERLDGLQTVTAGEAVRFAPGEFQTCTNRSDADLVILAVGAPPDSSDVRIPATCPDCGHPALGLATGGAGLRFQCPDCTSEFVPLPCSECGSDDLTMHRVGDGVRAVCENCGASFDEPPKEPGE